MTAAFTALRDVPPFGARLDGVTVRFGRTTALDGVDLTLRPGVVTGLLGRNGAGKSTLLQVLAGFTRAAAGDVVVGPPGHQESPWENAWVTSGVHLVRGSGDLMADELVKWSLRQYANLRPQWDADLAGRLLDLFEIDPRAKAGALSRGKRTAVGAVIGLASRAPLTIFDEAYLGMDAPTRYAFYDELLADYAEHPRTVVLSSHLVEETERLFEDVVVLDGGRVLLAEPAEELRERGHSLTGPAAAVGRLVDAAVAAGARELHRQRLGGTVQVTLEGPADHAAARAAGVEVGAVPVHDLFVRLTGQQPHAGPRAPGALASRTDGLTTTNGEPR